MYTALLGYDIRLAPEEYLDELNASEYRERIIKPEIEWPITIGYAIWPSVFKYNELPPELAQYESQFDKEQILVDASEWRHRYLELWQLWEDMVAFYRSFSPKRKSIAIALTAIYEEPLEQNEYLASIVPYLDGVVPSDWIFLGYDIADDGTRFSFLADSLNNDELPLLRKLWGSYLNEYGLFTDTQKALEYCRTVEDPSHGPFHVIGIYRHPDIINAG